MRAQSFLAIAAVVGLAGGPLAGCGASSPYTEGDSGSGGGGDGAIAQDAATPMPPLTLPARVELVHGVYGLGAVRLCANANEPEAVPSDNVVPRSNYAGLAPRASAFIRQTLALDTDAFVVDARKLASVEKKQDGTVPISCANARTAFSSDLLAVPPVSVPSSGPTLLALVGCAPKAPMGSAELCGGADPQTGVLALASIPLTNMLRAQSSAVDFVLLSSTLTAATFGFVPVGQCPSERSAVPSRGTVEHIDSWTPPTSGWDTDGLVLCDASNRVVASWSYAAMQAASAPSSTPMEHYGRNALFAFAVVGEPNADPQWAPVALALPYEATH